MRTQTVADYYSGAWPGFAPPLTPLSDGRPLLWRATRQIVASLIATIFAQPPLQTLRRNNLRSTRAEYLKVLAMKTGELFALACDLGAFLSGAPLREREALRGYGMALGTAYQVYDDCLDLFGSEGAAGKSLGTDLAKGKVTLPLLVLLESNDALVREKIESLLGEYQAANLPQINALLQRHGALHKSSRVIRQHLDAARELVNGLRPGEGRDGLVNLCEVLSRQTESLGGGC